MKGHWSHCWFLSWLMHFLVIAKEEIKQTLWILGDQVENIAEETTRTKAMLFSAIHLHVSTAIQILPAVINIAGKTMAKEFYPCEGTFL